MVPALLLPLRTAKVMALALAVVLALALAAELGRPQQPVLVPVLEQWPVLAHSRRVGVTAPIKAVAPVTTPAIRSRSKPNAAVCGEWSGDCAQGSRICVQAWHTVGGVACLPSYPAT